MRQENDSCVREGNDGKIWKCEGNMGQREKKEFGLDVFEDPEK